MLKLSSAPKYEHPNSRRAPNRGRRQENSFKYSPPIPLETDTSLQWDKGDPMPHGGPLPFEHGTEKVVKAIRSYGSGNRESPRVMWSNGEVLDLEDYKPEVLEAHNSFASHIAKELGFTHIWIRKKVHGVETRRNQTTGMRTSGTKKSQDHITVFLGIKQDWIIVGGHIFMLRSDGDQTLELMPEDQMKPDERTGRRRRVKELWKWDEKGTVQQQHRNKQLKGMSWRK